MQRIALDVEGIVQGVGFRPYIYKLATSLNLTGTVLNNPHGVQIEVQGTKKHIQSFMTSLQFNAPPLAQITSLKTKVIPPITESSFEIVKSEVTTRRKTLISPDIATCPDCLKELNNPADRRHLYPFINCTNCGPRYTIIKDIPYDRPLTTMSVFPMCPACQIEYDDPSDRRFHAQPNACPVCGPSISLFKNKTRLVENPMETVIGALKSGNIVTIKGLGGYHLAVDATNENAVKELRTRKHRFEKPLALMVKNIESAKMVAEIDESRKNLLNSMHRPIVLCQRRAGSTVAESVSLDNNWLGIMLPYSPLHELLFTSGELEFIVMTSANISEEPICYKNDECFERMENISDYFLIHNRDINIRCDDSVQQIYRSDPIFLRRSRGYAPRPVILSEKGASVLALGAHLKNTVCVTRDNLAFVSQHIGDLENLQTLAVFEQTIIHLQKINDIEPQSVIHDLHPEYLSTKWAHENTSARRFGVQHHYAHILSVMAEHGLRERVIGVALDGTGYGSDGSVWGGEILTCDENSFSRAAHFEYRAMPGGEKAIKEPWRMAASYILADDNLENNVLMRLFPERDTECKLINKMIERNLNSPLTSSCGRLFDAVAAILGLRDTVSYEGQAAIILESLARDASTDVLPDIGQIEIIEDGDNLVLSPKQIIRFLIAEKLSGAPVAGLSLAFHSALISGLAEGVKRIKSITGINKVALSGGCFQNFILLEGLHDNLEKSGFQVYINREVPANDGGISLGQAYWGMNNCG